MESPTLTPSGGEFLSQLGKTWNLIQSKAKELDKAKKKQRKTEEELVSSKENCEHLRAKEQQAVSKIAELESNLKQKSVELQGEIQEVMEIVL